MHQSSYERMKRLSRKFLADKVGKPLRILDVGSRVGRGLSYRSLFKRKGWKYTGLDMSAGKNVNVVSSEPYKYPLESESFDVVISGQCMEHVPAPWLWIKELKRVCTCGGLLIIIAPWGWDEHAHPVDCWRILPDGMRFLLVEWAGLEVLSCGKERIGKRQGDCWGVASKRA